MKPIFLIWILPVAITLYSPAGFAQENNPYEAMPVTDVEGNTYKTIITQDGMWMAENLRTAKFNDGTPIQFVENNSDWGKIKTPAYGWYRNDEEYKKIYGAIYNWYTIGTQKLCPAGWHIPSNDEWNSIMDYAGGNERSGDNPGKLKESGTLHWKSPNEGATNEIFFTALPAGEISYFYSDAEPGTMTDWWTATEDRDPDTDADSSPNNSLVVGLRYDFHSKSAGTYEKEAALPVRCKKDE